MAIFLGIDGGGTKTSCLVGDESSILGAGSAGGCNVVRVGEAAARAALSAAIGAACMRAGVSPERIGRTCIGVAGAERPQTREVISRILAGTVSGKTEIVGDMVTALEAGFGCDPGLVAIAGTGSIAYGVNARGQAARAGGWGFAISDEGSGHWIGRAAVGAVMRSLDQEAPGAGNSTLLAGILRFFESRSIEELVLAANASPPPNFAGLFPVVLTASEAGDRSASQVLRLAGLELAGLAGIVAEKLFSAAEAVPVAMCGGVFAHSALVRQAFSEAMRTRCPEAKLRSDIVEPVYGALGRARRGGA